jgi:hypothetical protein
MKDDSVVWRCAPTSPGGTTMASRYSVVCRSCLYQSTHSSRWEASIDVEAHLRDNPTHSVTVVEEGRRDRPSVAFWQ